MAAIHSVSSVLVLLLLLQRLTASATADMVTVRVTMPTFADLGHTVHLQCHWKISRGNLYSLKWYFDDREFFAYMPDDQPVKTLHQLHGFSVNMDESNEHQVVLMGVDHSATGKYRCEVTSVISEGPAFYAADKGAYMTVVKIPKEKPVIYGMKQEYHLGDLAHLTCISAPSRPAASLTWYINDEEAPSEYLVDLASSRSENGDIQTRRGLQFTVGQEHFRQGQMNLRCSARISSMYHKTMQHSIDGHPSYTAPVMESRDYSARAGSNNTITHHTGWLWDVASVLLLVIFRMLTSFLLVSTR